MSMTFVLVFAIMLLVVLGMAVGVIMGRKPIAGSCGGIANLGIEKECSICGGNREKCEEVRREGDVVESSLAYDATKR
ncbi:hypothetical protein D3C81_2002760 [compost metagenome]|jgi:hypothetical protein